MYIIKEKPEDFNVEEIPRFKLKDKGDYSYFLLEKRLWETKKAIKEICKRLKLSEKRINICSIKDKRAITKQYISIYKIDKDRVENLKIKDLKLKFIGYGDERLRLGDIKENKFKIVVRNLDKKIRIPTLLRVENYFDDQRFRENNIILGKLLLKRDFKEFFSVLNFNIKNNYINELRKIDRWLLRFYISSYQSFLFNKYLSEYIKSRCKNYFYSEYKEGRLLFCDKKIKNLKIPIFNFDTKKDRIYDKISKDEGIKKEDFLIRELPELINETNYRDAFVDVGIKSKYSKDELYKGKYKCLLEFSLKSGSYATIVFKKIFSKGF